MMIAKKTYSNFYKHEEWLIFPAYQAEAKSLALSFLSRPERLTSAPECTQTNGKGHYFNFRKSARR
jgi:agmatine/peptidylarginine deiminase